MRKHISRAIYCIWTTKSPETTGANDTHRYNDHDSYISISPNILYDATGIFRCYKCKHLSRAICACLYDTCYFKHAGGQYHNKMQYRRNCCQCSTHGQSRTTFIITTISATLGQQCTSSSNTYNFFICRCNRCKHL